MIGMGDASWTSWGLPRWQLVTSLAVGWVLVYLCLIRGIQSMGKIVYFTALFPYVILTALLVRTMTLPGAIDGIMFFIRPDWERLLHPGVWGDASSQIFYSFGLACGSLVALASYNKVQVNDLAIYSHFHKFHYSSRTTVTLMPILCPLLISALPFSGGLWCFQLSDFYRKPFKYQLTRW